jgi:uncharacterized membrane protein
MGGWLGMLGGLLLIAGVIVLVTWSVAKVGQVQQPPQWPATPPAGGDAIEILRVRFARGEMTADEYLAAKQTLEADR